MTMNEQSEAIVLKAAIDAQRQCEHVGHPDLARLAKEHSVCPDCMLHAQAALNLEQLRHKESTRLPPASVVVVRDMNAPIKLTKRLSDELSRHHLQLRRQSANTYEWIPARNGSSLKRLFDPFGRHPLAQMDGLYVTLIEAQEKTLVRCQLDFTSLRHAFVFGLVALAAMAVASAILLPAIVTALVVQPLLGLLFLIYKGTHRTIGDATGRLELLLAGLDTDTPSQAPPQRR